MIKFTDVSFGFPQKDLYNEICFEVVEGDHAALIGSNGTGKSTLIDMIIHTDDYLYDGKIEKDGTAEKIRGNLCGDGDFRRYGRSLWPLSESIG